MTTKIALPKGRLMAETAALIKQAGWGLEGYHDKTRVYRFASETFDGLNAKIFNERDVPIQVAIGNYDVGICGLDWVEELLVKYPSSALVKLRGLGYGEGALHIVGAVSDGGGFSIDNIQADTGVVRIASEYPNLAESLALNLRLKCFSIFPLWGGAEAYPPESAELALIPGGRGERHFGYNLVSLGEIKRYGAVLIANKQSWESKDLSKIISPLERVLTADERHSPAPPVPRASAAIKADFPAAESDIVRLALPDGHQQTPTIELLERSGVEIEDYPSPTGNRRPVIKLDGVAVKVIRPQDMPLQVAGGNFDLALTGKDWVRDHLYQFPSSPVEELLDLKFGQVRIVAVMPQEAAVTDVYSLREFNSGRDKPLRVASEYTNIADKYARDNHLGRYRIVPTWGATEAFLPEDADLLIENTQTGKTLAKNNLKIIDTIGHSSGCLIGRADDRSRVKQSRIDNIVSILENAVKDD